VDAPNRSADRPEPKPGILDIQAYVPGKSRAEGVAEPIKLSSNENILGCSDKAREAYLAAAGRLHLYPDSRTGILRTAIAERYDLEPERLVFGCGTDEVFVLLNQVYLEPGDNIVMGQYGFAAYAIGARACQGEVRRAPESNFTVAPFEMLDQVDERTRLMFIANPANPTGTFIGRDQIEALHAALPPHVILVLDGAYAEFATDPSFDDGLDLARGAQNLVVTHTFSKIHGLASLRVGWAYCPLPVAQAIDRIRLPFNTSIAAQEAAVASLGDEAFARASLEHVERWRPWLAQQLGGLGLEVTPSAANFILVGFPHAPGRTAAEAEAFLASRGLLVRGLGNYGLGDRLRITIGLEAHNRALIEALREFLTP
jgi:histidinol-phosphate aminotransferase